MRQQHCVAFFRVLLPDALTNLRMKPCQKTNSQAAIFGQNTNLRVTKICLFLTCAHVVAHFLLASEVWIIKVLYRWRNSWNSVFIKSLNTWSTLSCLLFICEPDIVVLAVLSHTFLQEVMCCAANSARCASLQLRKKQFIIFFSLSSDYSRCICRFGRKKWFVINYWFLETLIDSVWMCKLLCNYKKNL